MKLTTNKLALLVLLSTLNSQLSTVFAQGTAFTYQGQLDASGQPANGTYDFRFNIYDAAGSSGNIIAGPLTNSATGVANGLFTVTLDFGSGVFTGPPRWLEIGVRTNGGGAFVTLSPRQDLTPSPYAIMANSASNLLGSLPATQLSGTVASSQLAGTYSGQLKLNNPLNVVCGDGSCLTGVSASSLDGLSAMSFWQLTGNSGTIPGVNFLGTTDNQPLELDVNGVRAFRLEPATSGGAPNVIGGSANNTVALGVDSATIGGGDQNTNYANDSTIGGGANNFVAASAVASTISGGQGNSIFNLFSFSGAGCTIGGGEKNTIGGGDDSTIAGGFGNQLGTNMDEATISGGDFNSIQDNAAHSVIAGGAGNQISTGCLDSTISGGVGNLIGTGCEGSTIAGGDDNQILGVIVAGMSNNFSIIGGGRYNTIQSNSYAVIAGGLSNQLSGNYSMVGGGMNNTVEDDYSTIAGGFGNALLTSAQYSSIAGGMANTIYPVAAWSLIGGGQNNIIQTGAVYSVLGGGLQNVIQTNFTFIGGGFQNTNAGTTSAIGGGQANSIQLGAGYSFIGGGNANTIQSNAGYAVIPGGQGNTATNYAFAAGHFAQATNTGAFVWADSQPIPFASTADNEFDIRAQGGLNVNGNGGARLMTLSSIGQLTVFGTSANGVEGHSTSSIASGVYGQSDGQGYGVAGRSSGSGKAVYGDNSNPAGWAGYFNGNVRVTGTINPASDRNLKQAFQPVDAREILEKVAALPIESWAYRSDAGRRHIGPVAQDFHAAFGLNGDDDKSIATVDADGVALAAIQGLNQKMDGELATLKDELKRRDAENAQLKARLEALEQIIRNQKAD